MARAKANPGSRPVMLTGNAARRINRVVQSVERGDRDTRGQIFPKSVGDDNSVRLCKTSSSWTKGTTATLNVWESGTPPNETQSSGVTIANCVNKFATVQSGKFVMIAQAGNGRWYLIAAECD